MLPKSLLWVPALFKISATIRKDKNEASKDSNKKDNKRENPHSIIKLDSGGVPYRDCPECEGKMYKDGNIWTCDMIGYSYKE